jgi:hypothetical protein
MRGRNAPHHKTIDTRPSKTGQQRSTAPANQRPAKQDPAGKQLITRQSEPGQLMRGRNALYHKTIDIRASKTGQQRTTVPDNQHQAKQDGAATQHNTRQGQAKSGSNAAQHQAISARRTLTPGNQHQAKQHPAATHHITRQLTPGQAIQGNNAAQH